MKKINYIYLIFLLPLLFSCELEQLPSDSVSSIQAFSSAKGIEQATVGQYDTFKKNIVIRGKSSWQYNMPRVIDMVNLQGDDIYITNSYNDLTSFNQYNPESRLLDGGFNLANWAAHYKNIAVCNKIISEVDATDVELKGLVGENYYLRALWYLSLTRTYGRPYTHGTDHLSVPLRLDPEADVQERATVGEVYAQIISDLEMAADLLPEATIRTRPSKEAAWALLSRVYVWMTDPSDASTANYADLAITNADKVLNSGKFALTSTGSYFGSSEIRPKNMPVGTPVNHYFSRAKEENETVFALGVLASDAGIIARGKMFMQTYEGLGFGQYCASEYYRDILASDNNDLRTNFVEPRYQLDENGNVKVDENGNDMIFNHKGYVQYNINKFSYMGGDPFLADIVYQRSAEVYLNRAEAYAKKALFGDGAAVQKALDDVNTIRSRAHADTYSSIADFSAIYPSNPGNPVADGETPNDADILDVVLTERFLELAWEFNRSEDVFRNKRNLYRNYLGPHLIKGIVNWESNRIIAPIPLDEMNANPLLVQNPN
ncbi:RagB/SusD family nutrient uptake outer membrane protein [uncultured Draconibacterium sp.]|uniref:RagB/SusD family nutrient uptake outer membrane protein n=1 Tax=uncultured Draconibacterium sp. TaxID=1573823 RepID=UPI0029C89CFB|nr:RagB/SusD family nutrient uptake outer membrane protein [uncultured Draconibacterium sp.]